MTRITIYGRRITPLLSGAEIVASTPEVLATEIKAETTRLDKIFKSAGIRAN